MWWIKSGNESSIGSNERYLLFLSNEKVNVSVASIETLWLWTKYNLIFMVFTVFVGHQQLIALLEFQFIKAWIGMH
jgi:hypothetical protein